MVVLEKILENFNLNINLTPEQYETFLEEVKNNQNILFKEVDLSQLEGISGVELTENFESLLENGKKENKRIIVAFTNPTGAKTGHLSWARSITENYCGFTALTSFSKKEVTEYIKKINKSYDSPFFNVWITLSGSPLIKSPELIFYLNSKLLELEKNLNKGKKTIDIFGPYESGKTTILSRYHGYFYKTRMDILTKYVYTDPKKILNKILNISPWEEERIFFLDEADGISNPECEILRKGLEKNFEQVVYATHKKLPSASAYIEMKLLK